MSIDLSKPYGQTDGKGGRFGKNFVGEVTSSGEDYDTNKTPGAPYCVRKYSRFAMQDRERVRFFHLLSDAQTAADALTVADPDPTRRYVAEASIK